MSLGLYISVPFCRTKCSYCNFASDVFSRAVFERYVERVAADIDRAAETAEQMGGVFERSGRLRFPRRRNPYDTRYSPIGKTICHDFAKF